MVVRTGNNKVGSAANPRIMVVDDDALVLDYVAALLLSSHYDVTRAESSREALDLFEAGFVPHLLVTDVSLGGGMTGIELARRARRILPDLKVLFFSGYAGSTGSEALPAGAAFLQKPFRAVHFLEKLRSILAESTDEA
jgi:CheY-like chemotaxis protein